MFSNLYLQILSHINRTLGLRARDWPVFSLMMAQIFMALALMISLRSLNTGLFLSAYPATVYPWYFLAEALLSFFLSLVYGQWISGRFGRRVENYGILWAFIVVIVIGRLLLITEQHWVSFAMPIFCDAMSALLMIQTWGLFSDVIDSRKARRLFPLIGLGGTFGAIFGGTLVSQLARQIGTLAFYWFMPLFLLVMIQVVRLLHRKAEVNTDTQSDTVFEQPGEQGLSEQLKQVLKGVLANRLVLMVLLITLCVRVASTILDFQLQLQLKASFAEDEISAYMGSFFALTSLATLVVQLAFEHRFLNAFGVVWGLASTPITLSMGIACVFLSPGLFAVTGAKFIETLTKNSMFKTAVELVYIPFEPQARRRLRMLANGLVALTTVPLATVVIIIFQKNTVVLLYTALGFAVLGIVFSLLLQGPYLKKLNDALIQRNHYWGMEGENQFSPEELEKLLTRGNADLIQFVISHLKPGQFQAHPQQLRQLIFHDNAHIREGAIRLMDDDSENSHQLLSDVLQYDTNFRVKLACARALRDIGNESDNWQFLALMEHKNIKMRAESLVFLFTRGGIEGILAGASNLQSMLADADPKQLQAAAYVIGEIGIRYFRNDFIKLLKHPDHNVQIATLKGACVSLPSELLPELMPYFALAHLRSGVVKVLLKHPAEAVLPICRQLLRIHRNKNAEILAVIALLGHFPEEESLEILFELIMEPNIQVKYHVIQALQKLKHKHELSLLSEKRKIEAQLQREFYYGFHYLYFLQQIKIELRQNPELSLLKNELELRIERVHEIIFRLLSLIYDNMEEALISFQSGSSRFRALSLEVLSYTVNQKELPIILGLLDDIGLSQKVALGQEHAYLEQEMPSPWWRHPLLIEDYWLRRISLWSYRSEGLMEEESNLFQSIEKMYILKQTQLFQGFSAEELYPVAQAAQSVLVPAQDTIFRQGHPGDAFYVIQSGSVALERGRKRISTLGPLEGFGELEIMKASPRVATVKSLEACELLKISRQDFIQLLDASSQFSRSMLEVLSERLNLHVLKFGATGPLALEQIQALENAKPE